MWFSFNQTGMVWLGDENVSLTMPFNPAEQQLSDAMMDLWGSFARGAGTTAGPESAHVPGGWPAYDPSASNGSFTLWLDTAEVITGKDAYKDTECYFWDVHYSP